MAKIGRNQRCPCGSGKKYKHCHGQNNGPAVIPDALIKAVREHEAAEEIRKKQQGLGKPIISTMFKDHQVVAVGKTIYWSKGWKTFPDFLSAYMKKKLGSDWGNAEIAKPLAERHPLMQWYDRYCRYQSEVIPTNGEVVSSTVTGVVACYLGTAYSLYLLDHNAELQDRLLNRLKNVGNFQGAYYELIVANILTRAGFTLTLEDETIPEFKHCEFAATSQRTGKKYWVEAKMRSIDGLLGKTASDGGPDDGKFTSKLIPHLNSALKKPAADERLVFIDLNAPVQKSADTIPSWVEPAMKRLERYEEKENTTGSSAYIVLTNFAFHRELDSNPTYPGVAFGLNIPDFSKPGIISVVEAWRRKQKHIDMHHIGASIESMLRFPSTLDGSLPSEAAGKSRIKIGESYFFEDHAEGFVAEVEDVTVDEGKKEAILMVKTSEGKRGITRSPMTDEEFSEYKEFGDAYFGKSDQGNKVVKDDFEMFEWLMYANRNMARDKMLDWFASWRNRAELEAMNDEELRIQYCNGLVSALVARRSKMPPSDAGGTPE